MIERGLRDYLLSKVDVTRLIGTRVFLVRRPQALIGTAPAITLTRLSSVRYYHLEGEAPAATPTIRLDIWGKGNNAEIDVFEVFEAVRLVISGFRGRWGGFDVLGCTILTDQMDAITSGDASDDWHFQYGMDLRITYVQPATMLSPHPPLFVRRLHRLRNGRVIRLQSRRVHAMRRTQ